MNATPMSQEYHNAHLACLRAEIIEKAAMRRSIFNLLESYTEAVVQSERDRCLTILNACATYWAPSSDTRSIIDVTVKRINEESHD